MWPWWTRLFAVLQELRRPRGAELRYRTDLFQWAAKNPGLDPTDPESVRRWHEWQAAKPSRP